MEKGLTTYPTHLYTWLDVSSYLAELSSSSQWPTWLLEADPYWDSLRVIVKPDTVDRDIWDWFKSILGVLTVDEEQSAILLEDLGDRRSLPVEIVREESSVDYDRRPQWADRRIVRSLEEPLPAPQAPLRNEIPIIAFHSFKGGVGRTLHCVAAARELAQMGKKVLLIDADLEAPGVTWMVADAIRVDFSFEDFLALMHGDAGDDFSEAIGMGKKFVLNQQLDGVMVMPSRRNSAVAAPPPIGPVDISTAERDPYIVSEVLQGLGSALDVDVILVDLRAGVSELSAPILMDPRIHRVFVSTISDQSVQGTLQVIHRLAGRAPSRASVDPDCSVILTQYNEDSHRNRLLEVAAAMRVEALALSGYGADSSDTVDADVAVQVMTSPFDARLLNLPASWSEVTDLIDRSQLREVVAPLIGKLQFSSLGDGSPIENSENEILSLSPDDSRVKLSYIADRLVYAENSSEADFLTTEALHNLVQAHQTEVPIEVVIGGKGAGKTFTYLQLCKRPNWAEFTAAVGVQASDLRIPTVPVLSSKNLEGPAADAIASQREAAALELTGRTPSSPQVIRDMVDEALSLGLNNSGWRRVWLACFAVAVGLEATPDNAEILLADLARKKSAIFVLDGLEDLFQEFTENQDEQRALRALLMDCPEWLRGLRGHPLGMVTFVRRDLAQSAVRQNFGQFEKRYENYALKWNQREALRLAAWVCQRGGALTCSSDEVRHASEIDLSDLMLQVWGDKMGTPKSKEARSEVWFFAALSDFRQQIQARDIVSFLKEAADKSVGADSRYDDRVLTPPAMRNALPICSNLKIDAISAENRPVGALLDRLKSLDVAAKKLPFRLDEVGLTSEQAQTLDANGVIFREEDQYWIPEIFRHGLGFAVPGGRRPRVIAVANLVRRRNDVPA